MQISVKVPLYARLDNPLLSSRHNRFLLQALPCPQPQVINCIKSIRYHCEGNESNETHQLKLTISIFMAVVVSVLAAGPAFAVTCAVDCNPLRGPLLSASLL